jgi:predicted TIM-barrel fold metal-dependent hydrolase
VTGPLIDVNVNFGRWPTRRYPLDEPAALAVKLASHGVVEAWAGSFDGVFQRDLAGANSRLAEACAGRKELRFIPLGAVNPTQEGWEQELKRCAEKHRMPGIRLHPNYHGYTLDHPEFARLIAATMERELFLAIAPLMEDERMMHPAMRVPAVDLAPLEKLLKANAGCRVVLLNVSTPLARGDQMRRLIDAGDVYLDIAMLEGVAAVERVLQDVPAERLLFGSYAPSFYCDAAALKLQESEVSEAQLHALCRDNARRLVSAP